ncbi:MAG: tetratricopeptide repeat protein [Candidatus Eisenbacteria bacterium]|uniref:Tetratricopeptide repeat protein n=1 Tax=Eiseniibacteriota bacterium TaxID=2212470 RepID=A0A849SHL4_UNCEI|nr:tetratricopeptide repeat protein [Candidatus Eisenbacteria bacterium]
MRNVSRFFAASLLIVCAAVASPQGAAADEIDRLIEQGRYRLARTRLEAVVAARPNDAREQARLAGLLQQFGELDRAAAAGEKAVALAPNDAQAHWALASVLGEKAQKAGTLQQLGLARRFKKEAERAAELDPKHFDSRIGLMVFHLEAPGIVGGDKKQAKALRDQIVALDPARAWQARSRFAAESRDTHALAAIYREAVKQNPRDYSAHITLASYLSPPWRSERGETERVAREALAIDPERSAAYALLAQVLANQKRWDELDALLAEAAAKFPDGRGPQYQAARVTLQFDAEAARSEKWLRYYLAVPPEPGSPTHAAARWRLAQAIEKQGRRDEAIAELKAAVALDPKFEPARKELKRLKS